jgi:hypothetical protein
VLFFAAFFSSAVGTLTDGTYSLSKFTAYSVQRYCLQFCLVDGDIGGGPALPAFLDCPNPYSNGCVCGTGVASSASSFITSCANKWCSGDPTDVSNGLSLYNHYCAGDLTTVTSAPLVTLDKLSDYSSLRTCAQSCLIGGPQDGGPAVGRALSCNDFTRIFYDACLCRPDLSSSASSFLTGCINRWCSGQTSDISAGISVLAKYCTDALAAPPTVTGGGSSGTDTTASSTPATPGHTSGEITNYTLA